MPSSEYNRPVEWKVEFGQWWRVEADTSRRVGTRKAKLIYDWIESPETASNPFLRGESDGDCSLKGEIMKTARAFAFQRDRSRAVNHCGTSSCYNGSIPTNICSQVLD